MRTFYALRYKDFCGDTQTLWTERSKKVAMIRFRSARGRCDDYRLIKVTETIIPYRK